MDTRGEINDNLNGILENVDEIFTLLGVPQGQGRSRQKVIEAIDDIEKKCRQLRHALIRAARAVGQGIRQDGKLDLRYNESRRMAAAASDKPIPKTVTPKLGETKKGGPDLRYGKRGSKLLIIKKRA